MTTNDIQNGFLLLIGVAVLINSGFLQYHLWQHREWQRREDERHRRTGALH